MSFRKISPNLNRLDIRETQVAAPQRLPGQRFGSGNFSPNGVRYQFARQFLGRGFGLSGLEEFRGRVFDDDFAAPSEVVGFWGRGRRAHEVGF